MSDTKNVELMLLRHFVQELYQTFRTQPDRTELEKGLDAFQATVATYATSLLDGKDEKFLQALNAGTADRNDVIARYQKILRGGSQLRGVPSSTLLKEIVLPTTFGNVLIMPYDIGEVLKAKDVLVKLSTTPMSEGGLPRVAEFAEGHSTRRIGDLTVMTSPFECKIFEGGALFTSGERLIGHANLLEHYATAVQKIRDENVYIDTWNLFIADFLRRAETVRTSMEAMLRREKQHQRLQRDTSHKPIVMNLSFHQSLLIPLTEIAGVANKAFIAGRQMRPSPATNLITMQTAKIGNAITLAVNVATAKANNFPVTHGDLIEIIGNAGLGIFSDMVDHLDKTYTFNPTMRDYLGIDMTTSAPQFMAPQSIPAIRLIIDNIIYQGMLANYGREPSKISFAFDERKRTIDVSYEKPQPIKLADELNRVAAKWNFEGKLAFAKSALGISSLTIVDIPQPEGTGTEADDKILNAPFAGGGNLISGFPYLGMSVFVASPSSFTIV